jgi:hypothetical protein
VHTDLEQKKLKKCLGVLRSLYDIDLPAGELNGSNPMGKFAKFLNSRKISTL